MKIAPIAAAVVIAAPALAQEVSQPELNYDELHDDWRMTDLLDSEVFTADRREIGEVHDAVLTAPGVIRSLIVETGAEMDGPGQFFEIAWPDVDYREPKRAVLLDGSLQDVAAKDFHPVETFYEGDETITSGRQLIGLDVDLVDSPRYGKVEEVLFDKRTGEATAWILEPNGWDQAAYALPYDLEWVPNPGTPARLPYDLDTMVDYSPYVHPSKDQEGMAEP